MRRYGQQQTDSASLSAAKGQQMYNFSDHDEARRHELLVIRCASFAVGRQPEREHDVETANLWMRALQRPGAAH